MTYDFSGYATKFNVKCSDGRTIRPGAFDEMDGKTVPLVWQHGHDQPENVLGHALLEKRGDGIYAFCTLNKTDRGSHTKEMVQHKDVNSLSIYANKLVQNSMDVVHGVIREVSIVLAGANPGALIDNIVLAHSDGEETTTDEAIIYSGEDVATTAESSSSDVSHSEGSLKMGSENQDSTSDDRTVGDVYNEMTDEQKNVVGFLVEEAMANATDQNDPEADPANNDGEPVKHSAEEGTNMSRNVFEGSDEKNTTTTLTHSQVEEIFEDAKNLGSLKDSVLKHAATYGISNIEELFPEAKNITSTPDFIKRRTEWVADVLAGTSKSPFSRIKSMQADITADEARAKGYIKGNLKKEEVFKLLKRSTTPTTIYKKQKLDRDDVIDITDFDVVAWIRGEMRLMLEEEIARAILIGDGRAIEDPDKIDEDNIRPIIKEDPLYAPTVTVTVAEGQAEGEAFMESVLRARKDYEGSGTPNLYTNTDFVTDMLLLKDKQTGRRIYNTEQELCSAMRVGKIVEVPQFTGLKNAEGKAVLGLVVNLRDYTIGADRGGQTTMFDDFDIDYNQWKYLLEVRMSGALTKVKSAMVIVK